MFLSFGYPKGSTLWSESREEVSGESQESETLLRCFCGEAAETAMPEGQGVKGIPLADVQLAEH
jgi:hypothetical protein